MIARNVGPDSEKNRNGILQARLHFLPLTTTAHFTFSGLLVWEITHQFFMIALLILPLIFNCLSLAVAVY